MTDRTINWVFRATDKTQQAFRSVDSKLAGINKTLKGFAGFTGFAAVAAGIGTLTKDLVQMGSELSDVADKFGISAESVQVLKFAAQQTGASFEQLQSALQFNTKLAGEAARGNTKAAETFRLLGLDAKAFADLPLDRRLSVIAEQLKSVQDPALRLDLTMKALGKSGADLAPLLAQGSGALAKYDRQLRESNSILSNEQTKALDDAGDAWDAFWLRLEIKGAPVLVATINFLEKLGKAAKDVSNFTGLIFGDETERMLRSAQGRDRGPTRRFSRSGSSQSALSAAEAAAIAGIPGKKSTANALAEFDKAFAEIDGILGKRRAAIAAEAGKIKSEIDGIFTGTRTPQESYFAALDRLEVLQKKYGLSAEVAGRQTVLLGQAYADAEQQIYNATNAGLESNKAFEEAARIAEAIKTPFEKYGDELERIGELQGYLTDDQVGRAVRLAGQNYADAQIAIARGNDELSDSTERLLRDLKTAADGFARDLTDSFFDATSSIGDMFKQLAITIAKALFTSQVTEPLIGSLLGSFGGARASGGPVSGGKSYLVGERGPEVFVPGSSGRIVPNGAGDGVQITNHFTVTSLDPKTAAQVLVANERLLTGMTRRAMIRAGRRPGLA
jgi:hypothetical protein